MPTRTHLRGALLGAALLGASGAALAKPPAYTLTNLGFATTLHGVPDGERREECFEKGCREPGGVAVAEGASGQGEGRVKITIREYKRPHAGRPELLALAHKLLGKAQSGKPVRLVSGLVDGHPAIEQWTVIDGCEREVSGRVLVALPDKVLEIETTAALEESPDGSASAVSRMTRILQGIRVRRLGDASLDPAKEGVRAREVTAAISARGCLAATPGGLRYGAGRMAAHRIAPLVRPVSITLDGERIEAEEGEPLAQALIAADRLVLARSPKLHRPRGPSCMRGACDGCLSRLDGAPNVMTCLVPAREGARVETQNVVGTRTLDLLRVTDWFFPNGMDHHHFLAGIPGVSAVMQTIARRVAGLGTLPEATAPRVAGVRREVDALVVGAGATGLGAASELLGQGASVMLVDDGLAAGGSVRALGRVALERLLSACPVDGALLRLRSTAAGVYGGEVLVAGPEGAERVRPRALLLATGAHDGAALFDGNDVPGVFSARAAALLAASGVLVGQRIVLAGEGPFASAFEALVGGKAELVRVPVKALVRVEGATRVGGVLLREGGRERRQRADALVVEVAPSPAFELAEQAGGRVLFRGEAGFLPEQDAAGRVAEGVWVAGESAGEPFAPDALAASGRRVAQAMQGHLR